MSAGYRKTGRGESFAAFKRGHWPAFAAFEEGRLDDYHRLCAQRLEQDQLRAAALAYCIECRNPLIGTDCGFQFCPYQRAGQHAKLARARGKRGKNDPPSDAFALACWLEAEYSLLRRRAPAKSRAEFLDDYAIFFPELAR